MYVQFKNIIYISNKKELKQLEQRTMFEFVHNKQPVFPTNWMAQMHACCKNSAIINILKHYIQVEELKCKRQYKFVNTIQLLKYIECQS